MSFFFSEIHFYQESTKPSIHLSLMKAGPFTLENHIALKASKCKDAVLNPYLRTAPTQFFKEVPHE